MGIESDQLESIFRSFEQVGNRGKQAEGTGLGLAISRKIVALMGSQLRVKSAVGQGSTFWFEVDVSTTTEWVTVSRAVSRGTITGYEGRRYRLLVVDDRWENRSVVIGLLEPIGFEVSEASNGQEALEKMMGLRFDVVITDLMMPVMDGYELLRRIRGSEQMKGIVVIAFSASVFERNKQQALKAGANDFLPKPVQAERLLQTLEQCLSLTWIYDESRETEPTYGTEVSQVDEMVPPDSDVLQMMLTLLQDGDIQRIIEVLEECMAADKTVAPFAQQALQLANSFQLQRLQSLFEQYL